jgi:hypothetical protein
VLVAFSLALLLILGALGLSFDIGRMYVTRSEGQSFVDSAAIAAALKLNGTSAGLQAARDAAAATVKGWQFGTRSFPFNSSTDVTFAKAITDPEPWPANPSPADGYACARVTTRVSLPIFLLPVLVGATSSSIAASGVAKQLQVAAPGPGHYGPFSPFGAPRMLDPTGEGWNPYDPFNMIGAEVRPLTAPITYQHGRLYNILWPNNQQVAQHSTQDDTVCPGDQYSSLVSIKTTSASSDTLGTSNRGYLYNPSSLIAATIVAGILPAGYPPLSTGADLYTDFLSVSNGAKHNNIVGGLQDRSNTDSDSTSQWYQDYVSGHHGNGQRIMLMPVNSGPCGGTTFTPQGKGGLPAYSGTNTCIFPVGDGTNNTVAFGSYKVVGWGRFFLLPPADYSVSGNKGACAEYIGPGEVEGGGAGNGTSLYVVKLIQ